MIAFAPWEDDFRKAAMILHQAKLTTGANTTSFKFRGLTFPSAADFYQRSFFVDGPVRMDLETFTLPFLWLLIGSIAGAFSLTLERANCC